MRNFFILISVFCLSSCFSDKNKIKTNTSINSNDSIFYTKKSDGTSLKTIFYNSKQKDSFRLRVRYLNGMFSDSMYISNSGFINGKSFELINDGVTLESEYLKIDKKNFLNQFWAIKDKDTLNFGNNCLVRINPYSDKKENYQIEILLRLSKYQNFSKLFFVYPKGGAFSKLNSDFSNYKEIEYDTIYNLISYKNQVNNENEEYWSKRSVVFNMNFDEKKENYLRGILIEQKDTSFIDNLGNKIESLNKSIFINENLKKGN